MTATPKYNRMEEGKNTKKTNRAWPKGKTLRTILRTTEVVKSQQAVVKGWFAGKVVSIYFKGPTLHGSPAKVILKDKDRKTVEFIQGRVYQGPNLEPYFVKAGEGR